MVVIAARDITRLDVTHLDPEPAPGAPAADTASSQSSSDQHQHIAIAVHSNNWGHVGVEHRVVLRA
ncbi:hypothetical protein GCM10009828_101010 [Actinoplanes couchii]|uniref:Uncharacterized protein n=1 Tax=Actinoplanes couchii TaxID=403638 RepID=A0ABQ3XLU1_9ACTN|nr:hypothetical protein Aco03nite_078880 [Actinoplanes couchii]